MAKAKDVQNKSLNNATFNNYAYGPGNYSTETIKIAAKQGALKDSNIYSIANNAKDEETLRNMQQRRRLDTVRTATRVNRIAVREDGGNVNSSPTVSKINKTY